MNHLKDRKNPPPQGKLPGIDDIEKMHERNSAQENGVRNTAVELGISKSFIAKQFYFELDGPPTYRQGRYECGGHLRCCCAGTQQAQFLNHALAISAGFALGCRDVVVLRKPVTGRNGVFLEHVEFQVNDLQDKSRSI